MTVAATTLADDVWAVLQTLGDFDTVTGAIPFRGDLVDDDGNRVDPPLDSDGRVHPYLVVYFGGGHATSLRAAGSRDKLAWTCYVSCVGGDDNGATWCSDRVREALTGLRVAGGILIELGEPNPPERSDSVQPPRFITRLIYRLNVTG